MNNKMLFQNLACNIKAYALISLCFIGSQSLAGNGSMEFTTISASTQLESGHTLIGAVGTIQEEFQGKIAYIGVAKKSNFGAVWQAGYFGYYAKQGDDTGIQEDHRIRGNLTFTTKVNGWVLKHRSRVEFRMGELSSGFRYRPAFTAMHPLKINGETLIPYAEIEPFYDFKQDYITLGLLSAGVKWMPNKNIIINAGYMDIYLNKANTHTKGPVIGVHFKL